MSGRSVGEALDARAASAAAKLGPDLAALVATLGAPVVDALPITGLPAQALSRATFRLTLADGRVVKGRRLDLAADADRIRLIVTSLDRPELPRILAKNGTALVEEWIAGVPLGRRVPDPIFLAKCGRVLGAIHATPVDAAVAEVAHSMGPVPATGSGARPAPEARLARIELVVGELLRDGVVSEAAAADLRAVARAHLPTEIGSGFVHRDFCRENIVRRPTGDPAVVDSGSVGIDAYDLDLARTWYRWPLPPAARHAFEAGYREHRHPESYAPHFPFWAVTVLAEATLFRARARTSGERVPLRRLERLLHDLRRGHVHAS